MMGIWKGLEDKMIQWMKPRNDFVFKLIFGSDNKDSKELLIAFLNDVLQVPEGQSLISVDILNPFFNKQHLTDKTSILDIQARVMGGMNVNVEIQLTNEYNIDKRTLYYSAKMIEEQLNEAEDYRKISKVITINLLDFHYFSHDTYQSCYRLTEERSGEPYPDLLQLHFLEMKKFVKCKEAGLIDPEDRIAKWLTFLTNEDDHLWEELGRENIYIGKAVEMLKAASSNPETRRQYEMREKALKDLVSMKEGAKEEGRREGKEEGKVVGKKEVVKKMLEKNMDIATIVEFTELPKETILRLQKELNNR